MAEPEKQLTEEPFYNIGAVTRATGIPGTTLHAWERRYGFPRASRTAGGHRLYTEQDIILLRWVKAQVDGGLATHQAILAAQRLNPRRAASRGPHTPVLGSGGLARFLYPPCGNN